MAEERSLHEGETLFELFTDSNAQYVLLDQVLIPYEQIARTHLIAVIAFVNRKIVDVTQQRIRPPKIPRLAFQKRLRQFRI